jgi:uncharacterized lipoprotein YddW (UPF0748 family)
VHYLIPVLLSLLGSEQAIDDFRYRDAKAAREAWKADGGTPPVEVAADGGRPVLVIPAPFRSQAKLERAVVDRQCPLDLAPVGGFTLEILVEHPAAVGHVSLYFRSGGGWYAAGKPVEGEGWQSLRFSKASFQTESTPAGWGHADGVRISPWRAAGNAARDTSIRLRRLAAVWHEVALVIPDKTAGGDGEARTAREAAATLAGMLEELGLGSDAIEESAVAAGALARRRVAILPYNPTLETDCAEALARYAEGPGKLVLCYTLSPRLGAILGFGHPKYIGQQRPGQFAEMRFEAGGIAGLPKSVRQASWNITAVEPVGQNARVLARWYDDAGQPTGHPAVLLSDRGAFLSHIILSDDREGKKQLLAAILGQLAPPLWKGMAQAALDRMGDIGHCRQTHDFFPHMVELFVNPPHLPRQELPAFFGNEAATTKFMRCLDSARQASERAQAEFARGAYPAAVESARKAHEGLVEAYLRAQPSPEREGRAMWNHSGTGAYPGDWDRTAKLLAANGFNMVLPNMLWGGLAHYASDLLPRSDTFRQYGDQIEQCCAAAKKHGIEVHVWKVNFNLATAPKDFIVRLRREGRTQVTADGKPCDWLCPSHPENRKLELESMLEVARKYPVAGLHFDYIRYPGRESCYCDGCRQRFEAQSGRKVSRWPEECYSGPRKGEYNDWRCRQITALVAAVSEQARKLRPDLKISAAVFGSYPGCRESVAQDWPEWVKAGYLDFLCPMDYTESDAEFAALVRSQIKLVGGRVPVYPGIGATASHAALTPDRVVGQIHYARTLGADGFTIFNLDRGTAESIVPAVGCGAGARRAVPPHRK